MMFIDEVIKKKEKLDDLLKTYNAFDHPVSHALIKGQIKAWNESLDLMAEIVSKDSDLAKFLMPDIDKSIEANRDFLIQLQTKSQNK